ncbi:MAG: L-glutamate gamma-semialdehyde dehydrogenase [Lentimicrobiaceae bacterium]|jgi:1-pyrroline-5-carboxylate dehydrogenase|nr:L-glutamate gamma-semialdehyde dehydrogenase [Lentimicrobiaceae bacterium]MCP4909451.1 L-glutamate gamma-semialdehyde dehydrogenase [Bacteroidota bacterium]MBT3454129.1 L-glutamate gamma-semialdehyde dehydrogenase [Lentimicrobiaceae bacterium]MBT3819337.1 L-glutamate gamma-semialdehyde dehydrogenase [Lentimicrobiaceae bacterium]MBT4061010.1 L-glutamate gamma-semialdehyde dehydrogenase [Lentimicrobiaceae bacterium]
MQESLFSVPPVKNEPVLSYISGSPEREKLIEALKCAKGYEADIPMIINGKEVRTDEKIMMNPPHERDHVLGYYHRGNESHVEDAINAALMAKKQWASVSWKQRASIFLKAAAMIAGPYRARINAATMLAQSKSAHQAEIDSACELADFLRFNVRYMTEIYTEQPNSDEINWNRLEQRELEGFVFALTPFNFTAIAGNLPSAPALMGNTVVWKPSNSQVYSAAIIMDIFMEAGLPEGVINLVFVSGPVAGKVIFSHPDFAGIHFTGSTGVFQNIWKEVGNNIHKYKSYPRIVGETGGKNFVLVHESSNPREVATALTRGAFEYQGQKCSAASRAYIPSNLWDQIWNDVKSDMDSIKMGSVEDLSNFVNAVIDEASFDKLEMFINNAKKDKNAKIIHGGNCDKSKGFFIEPTIILTKDPHYITMEEELFGPVLTIYVYDPKDFDEVIDLVDTTSIYALTGSIFSKDRYIIEKVLKRLNHAAGNFYINDKPTGAVVNMQPFGGARGSGTNDKAGSKLNLLRWVSPRTIKECLLPPKNYRYPFLEK